MIEFALGVIGGVVITCMITSAGRCSLMEENEWLFESNCNLWIENQELKHEIKELNTK